MTGKPRILEIDIETSPHLAYTFGLFNTTISPKQIVEPSRMLCFAARWEDEKKVIFKSEYHDGLEEMLSVLYDLLEEADAVVGYNSKSFDCKHINREFLLNGYKPPSPYSHIDLYSVVRQNFKFASNKLDWVSNSLGIGQKVEHEGFQLWLDCLDGKRAAWRKMRKYNIQDTRLLRDLHKKLKGWTKGIPNMGLYTDAKEPVCPACGSKKVSKNGLAHTKVNTYRRYKCSDCGKSSRGRTALHLVKPGVLT